ncbi:MAG: response regulator [Nitrospiraceae bacterium]|nr:response regulator [Nitrospiraceae bacterium]
MKKILIADGLNPFIREEKTLLDRGDFQIFTTNSGIDALEIHRANKMDLILADLNTPDMAGDEMTKIIRTVPELKRVSIILITSLKKADFERCAACGANDYITRPIDPQKLLSKVAWLISVYERKDLRVLIKSRVIGSFGRDPFFGTTCNISASGLLLETEKVLARGDVISSAFFIPDIERISAKCRVMRIVRHEKMFQYGMQFVEISEQDKMIIEDFVLKTL